MIPNKRDPHQSSSPAPELDPFPPRRPRTTALLQFSTGPTGLAILALGPVLTVVLLPLLGWDAALTRSATWVFLAFWTPLLPIGVPSLMLQDYRDQVARGRGALTRAVALVVGLYLNGPAPVRRASWTNLVGMAIGVGAAILLKR